MTAMETAAVVAVAL
jgi:hypothetical protein